MMWLPATESSASRPANAGTNGESGCSLRSRRISRISCSRGGRWPSGSTPAARARFQELWMRLDTDASTAPASTLS